MFFHVRVFLHSLFFWGLLELASTDRVGSVLSDIFDRHLWLGLLLLAGILTYFYQITKKFSGRIVMTPMPVMFVLSSFSLLYLIESSSGQHLLSALSAAIYYFMQISLYRLKVYGKDQTARGIIAAATVTTIFLSYAAAYGFYLNFAIPLGFLMVFLMLVTTLITFQYFWLVKRKKQIVLNYSLVLGLVMAEIIWVVNFWPFGYLTTAAVTLIFYYVFWDMVHCHFLERLSQKRVVANMIFFGILAALLLASSQWLPVV